MTREEREAAIVYIKSYRKLDENLHNMTPKETISFFATEKCIKYWDMAIKALEQEPVLDKIKAEIKEWYWQADKQALAKDPCVVDAMIDLFIRTIDKYKVESEEM